MPLAACLAYCPIANSNDTAGFTALEGDGSATNPGCMGNADTAVCLTEATAAWSTTGKCASYFTADGGIVAGSAFDKCETLMAPWQSTTTAPTAAQDEAYFGEICGG